MSDEPLIFEHTSDEPEQNGFPLDTADLPLDSVDSSDSEEDVNQLLDLISKDYTNEDEDDEEEPLVYDDDSSDNEESYLQEPEVSLFSEDDDESVFEDDKEEKGDKANTSLDDIFNDALSAIQFEDSGKKEESEPEAVPSDIQGDLEEPPVQMVETAEPEKELKQAKGDGFWKRTFGNIITEQSAEEEQKERELEEADAKKKAELKAETKKQQEKEREEKAEEKQKIAEQKNLEKAEKKEKKRLAKEEKKQRKAELAAAEVVGKINPVGATIVMVFMMYPRANVSAKRIMEVLDTKPSIVNDENSIQLDSIQTLSFKDVTFSYPNGEEAVLKNIDFSCHKGQKIAVIGSTGSGKSTLVKLMNRFYDVSRGSIEINGVDIRKYNLESLRTQIGYVAQKAHMFKGSIQSNICFGKPEASVEEMVHAATVAQASDFISTREHGYEDEIAEDGTNISGGQKQRLSIARVILKKPSLYIYDDSFSALDFKTDATLRKALKPEVKNAIFFVVAQRISTIMDSDMIIVLDEGQIIGMGTHAQLLKDCSVYQEIAHSQLTQKELDDYERN